MEMRDVFDKDGRFTGKTVPKHAQLEKGEYFLHAIVILRMEEGGYLLQQRSLKARWYAGAWDVTGGGASAGETSAQAAAREAREELGLSLSPEKLRFLLRQRTEWEDGAGLITDTFLARAQLPPQGVRPNPREVNDWKIVPFEAYYRAVMFNKDAEFGRALRRAEEEMNSL